MTGTDSPNRQLHPYEKPVFAWPSIYLSGEWPLLYPAMELLLYGAIEPHDDAPIWHETPKSETNRTRTPVKHLDSALLKMLLKGWTRGEISKRTGLSPGTVSTISNSYPELAARSRAAAKRIPNG